MTNTAHLGTVEVPRSTLIQLYQESKSKLQKKLEEVFGKHVFVVDIKDRLNSVEDACELTGTDYRELLPYPVPKNERQDYLNHVAMADVICEAANEGWTRKDDGTEKIWFPVYLLSPGSGLVFDFSDYGYRNADAGSRLGFQTKEKSDHFGKKFEHIFSKISIKRK